MRDGQLERNRVAFAACGPCEHRRASGHCGADGRMLGAVMAAWACPLGRFEGQASAPWPMAITGGVGTELAALLKELGADAVEGCGCAVRAAEMDRLGVAWCEAHVPEICAWLVAGAARAGVAVHPALAGAVVAEAIERFKGRVRTACEGRSTGV